MARSRPTVTLSTAPARPSPSRSCRRSAFIPSKHLMTSRTPLDSPTVHPLFEYPLYAHELQSPGSQCAPAVGSPDLWCSIGGMLKLDDVNYMRGLRDALFLLSRSTGDGTPRDATPEQRDRERAFWWLATHGRLLDEVLPSRDAVRELVTQLAGGRWHPNAVSDLLDDVDQLLAGMRKTYRASKRAVAPVEPSSPR